MRQTQTRRVKGKKEGGHNRNFNGRVTKRGNRPHFKSKWGRVRRLGLEKQERGGDRDRGGEIGLAKCDCGVFERQGSD